MKKGITPIIAIILLLMMTVAAASAAFFWLIKIQGQMQGGAEQYQERVFERIAASVNWLDADYNSTNEYLTIYIQNAGTNDISLDVNSAGTDPTTTWILKDANQVGICSAKWNETTDHAAGSYNVKCVSGCGGILEESATAKIELNLSNTLCDISSYSSDSLFYVDVYFSGKASTSGTFDS